MSGTSPEMQVTLVITIGRSRCIAAPTKASWRGRPSASPWSMRSSKSTALLTMIPNRASTPKVAMKLKGVPVSFRANTTPISVKGIVARITPSLRKELNCHTNSISIARNARGM